MSGRAPGSIDLTTFSQPTIPSGVRPARHHREPAVLDFAEITSRRFTTWDMGSLEPLAANRRIFYKYSHSASFDPCSMGSATLQAFFNERLTDSEWIV